MASLSDPHSPTPSLTLDRPGNYTARLIVNDGELDSIPDLVILSTLNSRPVANAGADQAISLGQSVIFDGGESSDADGDLLSFRWSLISQPPGSTAFLSDLEQVQTGLTPDLVGDYVAQLIVNDGQLPSDPDSALVTVAPPPNDAVRIISTPPTSATVGQPYQYDVEATDTLGRSLSYSLMVAPVGMNIDPASGLIAWTPTSPDDANVSVNVGNGAGSLVTQSFVIQLEAAAMVGVPTVTGLSQADATAALTNVGLVLGNVTQANSDSVPLGAVISQVPDSGASVPAQTAVDLVLSLGPSIGDLPPDPASVAPAIDPTVATTIDASTEFLYTGSNPIQTGVAPGTIEAQRVAILRGRVLDKENRPLPGVTISVLDHPELGQTLSRTDGMFDLAVNGGGLLTINYVKDSYLQVQRQENVPWQDYVAIDDAVMIGKDPGVSTVTFNDPASIQVARGSAVTDDSGARRATLVIPPGTTAQVYNADGTTRTVSALHVRLTEYTVGENGPESMPAPLPPTSGYTYAVELSADEAPVKIAGKDVLFNQPVYLYLENFLGFPTGIQVPIAYYDRDKAAWIPSPDGRIIKILSVTGGLAELDTNGDNVVDNGAELGITEAERQQLAGLYAAGQSLERVPVYHFSTHDPNYGIGCGEGQTCPVAQPDPAKSDDGGKLCGGCGGAPTTSFGSIIENENQILGESIGINGTPLTLNYRSDRVPGRLSSRRVVIPLTNATVPANLLRIDLEIKVAGRTITQQSFAPTPDLSHTFAWDGLDAYGRPVHGTTPALIRIGYVYPAYYNLPPSMSASFGSSSGKPVPGNVRARQDLTQWNEQTVILGSWGMGSQPVGGWSLLPHHRYDPVERVLYLGSGERRSTNDFIGNQIATQAGTGIRGFSGDGGPATSAKIDSPYGIAVGPDGSLYMSDSVNYPRIRRIGPDGVITTIAGNGTRGYSGDGGAATAAKLYHPAGIAIGPDGSLYIADSENASVRKVTPDGMITTVAGNGSGGSGSNGDGGPAIAVSLGRPVGVAVSPDGSLYIADASAGRVRKVGPDGIITTVAGNGAGYWGGDGGPATSASLMGPSAIALGADGSLYIAESLDSSNQYVRSFRVRKVGPDGIISTVAGSNNAGYSGDGGPAVSALLSSPSGLAIGRDGSLYIADYGNQRIRQIGTDGIITTVAGVGTVAFSGDAGPATLAGVNPLSVAMGPNGSSLYVADAGNARLRKIDPGMPGFSINDMAVTSDDGAEIYRFDSTGRHRETRSTLTGAVLYQFAYTASGQLAAITDANRNVTTIERDATNTPRAILGPFGQRTTLTVDPNGYLASVTNPAGEAYRIAYTADGLLTQFIDPKGNRSTMSYDAMGRLLRDTNAVGGSFSLARTEINSSATVTQGHESTVTSGLGLASTHRVETLTTGEQRRTHLYPDGTTTITLNGTNGGVQTTLPDGTATVVKQGPDPRFGMQSPVMTETSLSTGGLTATSTASRAVSLATAGDPLSLLSLTETSTLNGRPAISHYDATSRTLTSTSPAGRSSSARLDPLGRVVEAQMPGIVPLNAAYDAQGRLASVSQGTGADARALSYAYDANGYLASVTDPLGREASFQYDLAGRVTTQTLPDGRQILYGYDAYGNLTSLTPPGQPAHRFRYTAIDQTADYVPPDVGAGTNDTLYTYDLDKKLTSVARPDGQTVAIHYDTVGRASSLTLQPGNQILSSYAYEPTTGKLIGIDVPDGGLTYNYHGALLTGTQWTGVVSGRVGYGYDNDFRVTSVSLNGTDPVTYGYDADSLLTKAGNLTLTRNAQNGLLTGTSLGQVSETYSYTGFGELSAYEATSGANALLTLGYTRDKLGRITQKQETRSMALHTFDYSYDTTGRLIEVKHDGALQSSYVYDDNGNRLSRTTPTGTQSGTYDAQDRLLTYGDASYDYTANGELATKTEGGQTTQYAYDVLGNLKQVVLPNGTVIDYLTDGRNRRVCKKVNGVLTQGFLWQGQLQPIAELDGSGNVVSRFVYATGVNVPDYMVKGGVTYRIIKDHLGSPRLVVDVTNNTVAQEMAYDEFGNVLVDTNPGFQPFGFAGGLYDRETGLVRFGARDYNPDLGRWLEKDPILFGGENSSIYVYSHNDGVNFVDSSGLKEEIGPATGGNCISYAWHGGMGDKDSLIDIIDNTLTDWIQVTHGWDNSIWDEINGSLHLPNNWNIMPGDLVVYFDKKGNPMHTGIVHDTGDDPHGSHSIIDSKWGFGPNGTKISLSIFKNKQLQPLMRFAESVSSALFLRVAMVTDLFLC
ncbi:RHS repeat-associated core domain-containing protein, partial [Thiocystis violacea]|uniref:NHL domain-containing protein n=1 Tax=Thiocystis violacea TaxID=13725 RepID=UPI0019045CA2